MEFAGQISLIAHAILSVLLCLGLGVAGFIGTDPLGQWE